MPVRPHLTLQRGTTSKLVFVWAREAESDEGKTGLRHDNPGASAAYVRLGEPRAQAVPLVQGEPGRWNPGGFAEVDSVAMSGVYQFGVPDEMLAAGSDRAILLVRFPGAVIEPVEVALVAYDPQDDNRLGLGSLEPTYHIAVLRRGMPGLTRRELALWDEAANDRDPDPQRGGS